MKDNSYNYLPDGKVITGYKLMANAVVAKLQILSDLRPGKLFPGKLFHIDEEMTSTRVLVMSLSNGYSAARDLFNSDIIYKVGEFSEDSMGIYYYSKLEYLMKSVLGHRWDFSNVPSIDLGKLKNIFSKIKDTVYESDKKISYIDIGGYK